MIRRNFLTLIRADAWWDYKLVPILSAYYATALVIGLPATAMWWDAPWLLLATATAAVYASLINDVTDLAGDLRAGKPNGIAGRPRSVVGALIVAAVAVGACVAWLWRHDVWLTSCYVATWLAFTVYSCRPLRLKERGVVGVLCDAAGEQLLPGLVAVLLAQRGASGPVSAAWTASAAAWLLGLGLRGILWHQLTDAANDRAAGVDTLAVRHPGAAATLGTYIAFPLELAALAAMLWQIGSAWPMASLVVYGLYAVHSARRWHTSPVIVVPKPRFFVVLQQFYSDLFPIALLIVASIRDERALVVLAAHLVLFPRRVGHVLRRLSASIARTVVRASEPHHGGVG